MTKKNQFKKLFEKATIEPADTQPRSTQAAQPEQQDETILPAEKPEDKVMDASSAEQSAAEPSLPSEEANAEITESVPAELETEAASPEADSPQDVMESISQPEESSAETPPTSEHADETSPEDLLEDVRHSLIEEELDKTKKESKWWRRIGRKRREATPHEAPANTEIDLPVPMNLMEGEEQAKETEEYTEQIDDLIDLLEAENQQSAVEANEIVPEPEALPEPEPEIDFEKLKEEAFRPRPAEESQSVSDVRSIALEGGEEVFVEVEAQTPDPMQERLSAFENALKPYRSYMYITIAFVGVVMAVLASLIIFNAYQRSVPQPVKEVPNLPYPTAVSLPGGWSFNLGQGTLQDGNWNPSGAEWLEGTEVCRWVSLPWSRQLEAVVRTLNPKDPIELVMSNNDKLTYAVYSVYEMTLQEVQALDSNSPCLLIILTPSDTQSESGKRWVLTALP